MKPTPPPASRPPPSRDLGENCAGMRNLQVLIALPAPFWHFSRLTNRGICSCSQNSGFSIQNKKSFLSGIVRLLFYCSYSEY
jgi:hypothetical protein